MWSNLILLCLSTLCHSWASDQSLQIQWPWVPCHLPFSWIQPYPESLWWELKRVLFPTSVPPALVLSPVTPVSVRLAHYSSSWWGNPSPWALTTLLLFILPSLGVSMTSLLFPISRLIHPPWLAFYSFVTCMTSCLLFVRNIWNSFSFLRGTLNNAGSLVIGI